VKVSKLNRPTHPIREVAGKEPLIYWGRPLFGPSNDEIDGTHVGDMTLRRDPVTGLLCGVLDAPKKKETA
jgi:hypothetical protein